MSYNSTYFPLTELIDELLKNGFIIGTDTYLRLHKLLDAIDIEAEYENLHQYLCPLFATDAKQQRKFYEIYNRVVLENRQTLQQASTLVAENAQKQASTLVELEPVKLRHSRLYYVAAVAALLLVVAVSFLIYSNKTKKIDADKQISTKQIDSLKNDIKDIKDRTKTVETQKQKTIETKDSLEKTKSLPKEKILEYEFRIKQYDSVIQRSDTVVKRAENLVKNNVAKQTQLDEQKSKIPYELIRYALLIIILLAFVLYEIYKYMSRRLIAKRKQERKPPYVWNIHIKDQSIDLDSDVYSVANSMRFRTLSGVSRIDMKKTIDYTAKNAGVPVLQYSFNTRPVEYLMLIDWSNERNHQAQLFDYLYRTFVNNNVYIERFYYDADPRICWNQYHANGITLDKLQRQSPDAYLLVFGNGAKFINPLNNALYQYTAIFGEWERRALLTPEPSAHWGVQEVTLRNLFPVILPASTEGMVELTEHFNIKSGEASDLKDWKYNIHKKKSYIHVTAENLEQNPQIPAPLKTWIAACAVYPELYWDLTIAIGRNLTNFTNLTNLAGFENPQGLKTFETLVSQENLALLARIDWFRTGKIPDEDRAILLQNKNLLPDIYKNTALTTVIDILQQNLKENGDLENTHARDHFLMNIVVSKLMLKTTKGQERAQLQETLQQLVQTNDVQDFVALEYINNQRNTVTDLLLPKRFKRFFYNGGNKLFGIRNTFKYASVLVLMLFTFVCKNPILFEPKDKQADTTKQQSDSTRFGTFTDTRDGKAYKTIRIGNQTWLAENLAYKPTSGNYWACENDRNNVPQYGYLYDWQTAQNAVPEGWHLPSDEEWNALERTVGLQDSDATKEGWRGTHANALKTSGTSGFNLTWGGYYDNKNFYNRQTLAYFWTSTAYDSLYSWKRGFSSSDTKSHRNWHSKKFGFSVRCVKDIPKQIKQKTKDFDVKTINNSDSDDKAFFKAQDINTEESYKRYITENPTGKHIKEAQTAINLIKQNNENADWLNTKNIGTEKAYSDFMTKYQNSKYKDSVEQRITELKISNSKLKVAVINKSNVYVYSDKELINKVKTVNFKQVFYQYEVNNKSIGIGNAKMEFYVSKDDIIETTSCLKNSNNISTLALLGGPEQNYFDSYIDNNKIGMLRIASYYYIFDTYPRNLKADQAQYILIGYAQNFELNNKELKTNANNVILGWVKSINYFFWESHFAIEPNLTEASIQEKKKENKYATIWTSVPEALKYSDNASANFSNLISSDKDLVF